MKFLVKVILGLTLILSFVQANEKVSLQLLWKHQFEFAGFYIAKERGFYTDLGLEVEIKEFNFGMDITSDVVNGKSDIGIGSSSVILDKLKGAKIMLLNALYQDSPHVIVSKKREDLQFVKDFKNKKIMLESSSSMAALLSMMRIHNIQTTDYRSIAYSFKTSKK
ncbi:MAG: ABC transporter substrate-binding protein [Campylobacterota bacterium]|nr:ABC transporter substrate-binding protein [Campylobacterota bacterium]